MCAWRAPPSSPPFDRVHLLQRYDADDEDDDLDELPFRPRLARKFERMLKQYLDYAAPLEEVDLGDKSSETPRPDTWERARQYTKDFPETAARLHLWLIPFAVAGIVLFVYMFGAFAKLHHVVPDSDNVQSDVMILMHNDLYGQQTHRLPVH